MDKLVSKYIFELDKALNLTSRAEDRAVYQKLLASSSVILALIVLNKDISLIVKRVHEHERVRGMSWLHDQVHNTSSSIWQDIVESSNAL